MIFDSPEMKDIREVYKELPLSEIPGIAKLDRLDEYQNERLYLEDLITRIDEPKQKDLLSKLICCDDGQHIGAWFELMLFGWLREKFPVSAGLKIENCDPDFVLDNNGSPIVIEAKACQLSQDERDICRNLNLLRAYLHEIQIPCFVYIEIENIGTSIYKDEFINFVTKWLKSSEGKPTLYKDENGNKFTLVKGFNLPSGSVRVGLSKSLNVNLKKIDRDLHEKAKQHQQIQLAGIPYIIAIFLESDEFSEDDIVTAWLGKPAVIIDRNGGGIVGRTTDRSGTQFAKNHPEKVVHQGVSGLLAFKSVLNRKKKTRQIFAKYIQAPFADNPICTNIFPVESKFIVVGQSDTCFDMMEVN